MDPMMMAIKKKRGSSVHTEDYSDPREEMSQPSASGGGLHEFVAGLNDQEKMQLKSILDKSNNSSAEITKGGPSSNEQQKIAEKSSEEDDMNEISEDEHDDIGMSMLDHKSKMDQPGTQPRNLGERVRMDIASKLKHKGKL